MKLIVISLFLILQLNYSYLMKLNNLKYTSLDISSKTNELNDKINRFNFLNDDLTAEEDIAIENYVTTPNSKIELNYQPNTENSLINHESNSDQTIKTNLIDTIDNTDEKKKEFITTPIPFAKNILNQSDQLKQSIKLNIKNNTLKSIINETSSISNQLDSFNKDIKLLQLNNEKLNDEFKLDDQKLASQSTEILPKNKLNQQLDQMQILLDNEHKKELKDNNRLRIISDEIIGSQVDNQFIEHMNKYDLIEDEEKIKPNEYKNYDSSTPDLPDISDNQMNDNDQSISTIQTNYCEKDKCESANQTNSNYYLVNCKSENSYYNCYYCEKNYKFIANRKTCVGPCFGEEECNLLLDKYAHVYCPVDYDDAFESNLCIKEDKFRNDSRPFSQSFFYIEKWQSIKPLNETDTLIHQINLENFKDTNDKDICEFKLEQKKLIDPKLDVNLTSPFRLIKEDNIVKIYLKTPSTFQEAQLIIDCTYKRFILHRSTLNFQKKLV